MGSPANEAGRENDEGPQHEVTIAEGFWLFDTPCTQALWEAVMGDNPSHFLSPTQPVESVSFEDVQNFLKRLNDRVPGLALTLPSEAQWEYACRAGTKTATYAGPMQIVGEYDASNSHFGPDSTRLDSFRNSGPLDGAISMRGARSQGSRIASNYHNENCWYDAPVLDGIAWYGGNTGVGLQKLRANNRTLPPGTRPVKSKTANSWGLYDMLGNVWEWCADHAHETYEGAPTDGSAWLDSNGNNVKRVFRGGSWRDRARWVRAAFRGHDPLTECIDDLGFRCVQTQDVSHASGVARPMDPAKRPRRSE
jgi:formylglycine-generating enzyme required for sulfatase activity